MQHERHLTVAVLWALGGAAAESGATLALLRQQTWHALALHVAAALAFGLFAVDGRPAKQLGPLNVAAALALTLPLLGPLGVCLVAVPAWRARRPSELDDLVEVGVPDLPFGADVGLRHGPIEAVLRGSRALHERVASVMALRRMDAQLAVPLLRVALGDPHEDVRLLAYAILERREKDLRNRIDAALSDFEALPNPSQTEDKAPRAAALRALAEHHWELANGGFVSGEVEAQTLGAAVRYGHASLLLVPDGSLSLLLARIRLRCGDASGALRYLRAANALGMSNAVLAPPYAEVAFLLRRFDAIAPLLAEAGEVARPRLDAVVQFWNGGTDA